MNAQNKIIAAVHGYADSIICRFLAAAVRVNDAGQYDDANEADPRAIHAAICNASGVVGLFNENTGGGVWVSYSLHKDPICGAAALLVSCNADGLTAQLIPRDEWAVLSRFNENPESIALYYWNERAQTLPEWQEVASAEYVADARTAAAKLWRAALLLNAESLRLYSGPLYDEQADALRDGSDCFGMLDDMEARMSFDVTEARALCTDAHVILENLPQGAADFVHELFLCSEYHQKMREFSANIPALQDYGSAEEVEFDCDAGGLHYIADWCRGFCERWEGGLTGMRGKYISRHSEEEEVSTPEECAELRRQLAEARKENAALREAYAALHDGVCVLVATKKDANDALRAAGVR